jgi:hypothetical protein
MALNDLLPRVGALSGILGGPVVAWVPVGSTFLNTAIFSADGSTFTKAAQYTVGPTPGYVIAADFNGDGNADLAVSNYGNLSNNAGGNIMILLGHGDGTFTAGATLDAGANPASNECR